MKFEFSPKGVCSSKMIFDIENDTIRSLEILDGCPGNLLGLSHLVQGMNIDEVIQRLDGIRCGRKRTSCPDQLAQALKAYKEQQSA